MRRKKKKKGEYSLMLPPISLRHGMSINDILLKRRIDDQLLGDGMSSKLPGELVLEAGALVRVIGLENGVEVGLDLAVVIFDRLGDGAVEDAGGREEACAAAWDKGFCGAEGKHCVNLAQLFVRYKKVAIINLMVRGGPRLSTFSSIELFQGSSTSTDYRPYRQC